MKSLSVVFAILYYFEIGSCVAQADLKLTRQETANDLEFLLSLPPESWDYRCERPRAG